MFAKVNPRPNFPKIEKKILDYWAKNKIFKKSVDKKASKGNYVFFEGPPTANGKPGVHHIEARAFKDLFPRYKTMRGHRVVRKAGWDTHGLPVELEVEKNLGFSGKRDIEEYGIERFNRKCKVSVWKYKEDWEEMTRRIGFWLDMEDPYVTFDNDYIESVWWIIKQVWDKGLLYQGHKVVPYCPRCGTALSSHEVAQGYKKVKEESVFVKFKIKDQISKIKNTNQKSKIKITSRFLNGKEDVYFLAWTTTPWTLPGNLALALGEDIDYVLVEVGAGLVPALHRNDAEPAQGDHKGRPYRECFILARERLEILEGKYKIIKEFKGKDLAGTPYEPLYPVFSGEESEHIYHSVLADFVTTDEGTGIVHTAVMYGEDDYRLGEKLGLPKRHTVNLQGKFKVKNQPSSPEPQVEGKSKIEAALQLLRKIEGKFVKDAEGDIVSDLKKRGLFYKSEMYEHDYPFCWRCKTPLLYYAKKSWFIAMSKLRKKLKENNEEINWVPDYLKHGRFGKWLEEVKDWAVSRERYWGTPLPVWQCQTGNFQFPISNFQTNYKLQISNSRQCGNVRVIGSVKELEKLSNRKIGDLHRPDIDKIKFKCEKCGGEMRRVLEVIDCWFDAGSMPFAQYHYPFENKAKIDRGEQYPADFICEAIDQTRGWFYTLLAISTLLDKGTSYKNVISLGHVLDVRGQKMSKSRGNVVDPFKALEQYSADALRWFFYTVNKPQESKNFDPQILRDIVSRFILTLWNSYSFFVTYANIDKFGRGDPKWSPGTRFYRRGRPHGAAPTGNILDKWIISRLTGLNKKIVQYLDDYNVLRSAKEIEKFVDDLSNWYIRRSRRRFWKSEDDQDKTEGYQTLYFVLVNLSKILAPFMPFVSEEIYRNLTGDDSVHLAAFPEIDQKLFDQKLNQQMEFVRQVVASGLSLRAKAGIKVRQPLSKFKVQSAKCLPSPRLRQAGKVTAGHLERQPRISPPLLELIKEELNVKEVKFVSGLKKAKGFLTAEEGGIKVGLDTKVTPELKREGMARDLVRAIQEARKKAGFQVSDRIELFVERKGMKFNKAISEWEEYIKKETLAVKISDQKGDVDYSEIVKIEGEEVWVGVKKIKSD